MNIGTLKNTTIWLVIILAIQFIAAFLVGGYTQKLSGVVGIILWIVAILGQIVMWGVLLLNGIRALLRKDFKVIGILFIYFLVIQATFLLLVGPQLFTK
jgi:hypothetical protein